MPVSPDLGVFERNKSFSDYQRANDEFAQRKALQQAQIVQAHAYAQKAMMPDYAEMGQAAFIKAATQGAESLTPTEKALLIQMDAKQQTASFNPVTGRLEMKPSLLDRAGISLGGTAQTLPAPAAPTSTKPSGRLPPDQQAPIINDLYGQSVPRPSVSPKTQQGLETAAVDSGRKRVDEIIASASSSGAAKQAANTMAALLPNMGYTGTGGGLTAATDKLLTGIGMPDLIAGKPAAREAFQTQGVDAWVKAVEPLKGALTEQEGSRFDLAVSNLTTTPEGIKLRAKLTEALANRAAEKSLFYQDYLAQNATLDGADAIWQKYSDENPVITDELLGVETAPQKITGKSPIVSTQAQYDALPSGAPYIEVGADGKPMQMRKP